MEKTIYGYPRREKKSGLRTKMKSFHSGYLDQEVRVKVYPFYSSQLGLDRGERCQDGTGDLTKNKFS